MNLQAEVSITEVAAVLCAMRGHGKTVRSYAALVKEGLMALHHIYGEGPNFTVEGAAQFLRGYGQFGLPVRQLSREDRSALGREEAAATAPAVPQMPGLPPEVFEEALRKIREKEGESQE